MNFDDDKYNLWFIYNVNKYTKRRGKRKLIVRFDSVYFNDDNNGELGDIHTNHISYSYKWSRVTEVAISMQSRSTSAILFQKYMVSEQK